MLVQLFWLFLFILVKDRFIKETYPSNNYTLYRNKFIIIKNLKLKSLKNSRNY